MKLAYSPASPYVRKVNACAIARGIDKQIERWKVGTTDPALLEFNPLSKVPTLITDDGARLYDSPVICEYLDSVGDAAALFPQGAARLRALKLQALGDGILDAAVGRRGEQGKPREAARDAWMARQKAVVERALALLESDPPHRAVDIGSIAIACALGYLEFRFAAEPWRETHPKLAAWYTAFARNPGIATTAPADAG
jgi:glutathione S-transferase